ncbi:MAG: methyltransferase domain-containing protein [Albidovulum sp.]|nr:methyltransferase domain-containing protein [Albidovulum sp.]
MNVRRKQEWDTSRYERNARFVSQLGSPLIEILAPKAEERILDLGCGDGFLTKQIEQAGARVVGIDTSENLLSAARERGLFVCFMDAPNLEFREEFDAVFSNAALHWMLDADGVLAGVARALKKGGRFVGEFGGHGNVAAILSALFGALKLNGFDEGFDNPWFFPTVDEYAKKLELHGFRVNEIALHPRPTPLPTGMKGWLDTFATPMLSAAGSEKRQEVLDEAIALLAPCLRDGDGNWTADYVRLRFAAVIA